MNENKQAESLAAILQSRALSQPDYPIFTYLADGETEEMPLTYAEFDQKARLLAAALQARQLQGQRVLLLFPQGLDYLVALFGCFYAGAIAVPAYPPRNNRNLLRLLAIMDNCEARAILSDRAGAAHIQKMDQDFSGYALLAYEDLIEAGLDWQPHRIAAEDIAYLQYTSGSTGTPKGVIIRHKNMMANAVQCQQTYTPEMMCAVNWIPMYHDMGLMSMMSYLLRNARCYFLSPVHFVQKPLRWLQAVSKYKAQFTLGPNFAFDLCCEKIKDEDIEGLDLNALESITSGSERVRLSTMLAFHDKFKSCGFDIGKFAPSYGLAEATLIVSTVGPAPTPDVVHKAKLRQALALSDLPRPISNPQDYHVSNGPAVHGATIRVVDHRTRQVQAEGQEGEIWICSPGSISTGYWGLEEDSQATFHNYLPAYPAERYLRTGDLGFMLQGELYITGRIKDIIIIRGRNYYPQDIEYVVANAHPSLQENSGAAFYLEENGQEQLVVVQEVRRAEWRAAQPDEVVDTIRQAISEAFDITPHRIALIFPLSLPKTSSGKVQRQATKEQLLAGKLRIMKEWQLETAETETPDLEGAIDQPSLLRWLRQKIAEKARMPLADIQAESAFDSYPIESVDAVELSEELSQQLGFQVEAEAFWAMPSIAALATFLAERHQAAKGR